MTAATSQKLADTLRAAGFEALALRAEADEFHDFLSPHATPEMQLAQELAHVITDKSVSERERTAADHIRTRLINGDFDASKEESDDWAESPEGQHAFKKLLKGK
jgi:hypothetical protein